MQAASLAYVTLLSIVPLMTVSLSILAVFPVFQGIGEHIQQVVVNNFVPSAAQVVQNYLQIFMQQATRLSVTGLLFLFVTAILMIFSLEQTFNRIWRVKKHRNIAQAFLMYWATLTLTPILLGVGFVLSSYVLSLSFFYSTIAEPEIKKLSLTIFPYVFTFLAFAVLYVIVPNCKVKIRHATAGAAIATLMFEFAKHGFTIYITHFPTYTLVYGALAIIPIFLLWLYLSWLIVLFGGFFAHSLRRLPKQKESV